MSIANRLRQLGGSRIRSFAGKRAWNPSLLEGALAIWLDASDESTITLNGSDVSQWDDKSGNNKNAVQAAGAKQPAYTPNLLSGKHGVVFNGASDCLTVASLTLNTFTTVFLVLKNPSGGVFFLEHSINGNNFPGFYIYGDQAASSLTRRVATSNFANYGSGAWMGASDTIITINTTSTPDVAGDIFRPFKDGTALARTPNAATTLTNSSVTETLNIGSRNDGAAVFFNGNLYEMIICNVSLGVSDQQKMEGYLAWKWGLQGNLPANHPYKSISPTT